MMEQVNHPNNQQQEVPREWQEQDHYELRVSWLSKESPAGNEKLEEELRELMLESGAEEEAELPSLEIAGHPGWWHYFNVEMGPHDSLDEALAAAKTVLKRSDLNPSDFNFGLPRGTKAPAQLSKSQRRKLIDQVMNPPARELPGGIVREAFVEAGDHALLVWIEALPFREEFSASFAAPENPLRSLIGKECVLKTQSYEDDEDFEALEEDFDEDVEADFDDDLDEDLDEDLEIDEDMADEDMDLVEAFFDEDDDLDEDFDEDIDEDFDEDDDLDEDAEGWEETARGILAIDGNTLRVGDWAHEIEPDEFVDGVAYEWAALESEAERLYIEAVTPEENP
jgi:hypothetical protein